MTHRDRVGDASGHWAGRRGAASDAGYPPSAAESAAAAEDGSSRPADARQPAHCRFARATGVAASPSFVGRGFRTVSRTACHAPHRRAMRSLPKTPTWKHGGNRLYESISRTFGIESSATRADTGSKTVPGCTQCPPARISRKALRRADQRMFEPLPPLVSSQCHASAKTAAAKRPPARKPQTLPSSSWSVWAFRGFQQSRAELFTRIPDKTLILILYTRLTPEPETPGMR